MQITDVILLGGGVGKRFSTGAVPKQFQLLESMPVFIHALRSFLALPQIRKAVLAFPGDYFSLASKQIQQYFPEAEPRTHFVQGGARRQDSSYRALQTLVEDPPNRVLIHDACRPYLAAEFLQRMEAIRQQPEVSAWIPVIPVADTLKRIKNGRVVETIDRSECFQVQTPQVFDFDVIWKLSEKVKNQPALNFTDDASICEYYGIPVGVFEGDVRNVKLTYEHERQILTTLLSNRKV